MLLTAGCSATRGYSGPDLPKEKISVINFDSSAGITLSSKQLDGTAEGLFNSGFEVLPGKHIATADITLETDERCSPVVCDRVTERDRDGDRREVKCTCYQSCDVAVFQSSCGIDFVSEAGQEYNVEIEGESYRPEGTTPAVTVYRAAGYRKVASERCRPFRYSHERTFERTPSSSYCNY
jgi:hypothetical protein